LKSLEGGEPPFGSTQAFLATLSDAGVTAAKLTGWIWRGETLPAEAISLVRRRYRRAIEDRIKTARRQLIETRSRLGDSETRTLVLIANDKYTFTNHAWLFSQICGVMMNFATDTAIDGLVYFSPNISSRPGERSREYGMWAPAYRDSADKKITSFVNELGYRWLKFLSAKAGEPTLEPIQVSDSDVAREFLRLPLHRR
jgi:hypothetical protein